MFLSKDINKFLHKVMNVRIQRTNLKYLLQALDDIYPDRWELTLAEINNTEEILCYQASCEKDKEYEYENFVQYFKRNQDIYYTITIHFPEVIITNGRRNHKITDLYVRLEILDNKNGPYIYNISGNRASKTVNEIYSCYNHSHLTSCRIPDQYFSSFCLGSGPIRREKDKISAYTTKDEYIYFLLLLDNFVKWESIAGVPYMHLDNIGSSEVKDNFTNRDKEFILNNCKFNNLNFKITDSSIEILPDSNIEEQLTTYLKDKGATSLMCYKTPEGKYVSNERKELVNNYKQYEGKELFTFKGETIKFKIINNENLDNYEYNTANPNFTKQICDKLSSKLTKKHILTSSGVTKKNIVKDTQESNASDKISV